MIKVESVKNRINQTYSAKWMVQAPLYIVIYGDKSKARVREYDKKVIQTSTAQ